jgi:hypothetical protein
VEDQQISSLNFPGLVKMGLLQNEVSFVVTCLQWQSNLCALSAYEKKQTANA